MFSDNPEDYVSADASADYDDDVREAVKHRAAGDLDGALSLFSDALYKGQSKNYPATYRVLADMADLKCRQHKKAEGLVLIQAYQCAAGVMAGEKQCWLDSTLPLRVPNPEISALCYAYACNPMFAPVYGRQSRAPEALKKQRMLVSHVAAECSP